MLHNLEDRVIELNRAAAAILREAVSSSGEDAIVAGDIGPSGSLLEPLGDMSFTQAVAAFRQQASALVDGGVDVIWIETMADLEEMRAAVEGVRQASADIPVITTMTFDTRGFTMMGVSPERAVAALSSLGATAVGGNCGNGPEEVIRVVEKMRATDPRAILVAKANAGIPELVGGKPVYRASPETMAAYAVEVSNAGAGIIGACCGSTPAHIQAIAGALAANRQSQQA
jgi:methionine synthase I (cobalamin-dependent)